VCIVKTCFTQSVVDLCWSPDGYSLIACSTDGTVAIFTFDQKELGIAMSDEARVGFLSETYGDLRRRVGPILEDPSLLRFEQQGTPSKPPLPPQTNAAVGPSAKAPKRVAPQAVAAPAPASNKENAVANGTATGTPVVNQVAPTAELQLETRGSDGRRRIMPVPQGRNRGGGADARSTSRDADRLPERVWPGGITAPLRAQATDRAHRDGWNRVGPVGSSRTSG
jgi:protein HIRA/HIR1